MDGQINPLTLNLGLAFGAKQLGATLLMREGVVDVLCDNGKVRGVRTDKREISAPIVVNAAGIYAPQIAQMVGLELPIQPRRGQLLITTPVPKMISTCMISASYIASKFDPSLAAEAARAVSLNRQKRDLYCWDPPVSLSVMTVARPLKALLALLKMPPGYCLL